MTRIGLATYIVQNPGCELITLDSLLKGTEGIPIRDEIELEIPLRWNLRIPASP